MKKAAKKNRSAKKNVSRFIVSFVVEVEHEGEATDAVYAVGDAVTDMVDYAYDQHGRKFESHGVKITDAVEFDAQVEQ